MRSAAIVRPAADGASMEAKAAESTGAICVLGMHRSGTSCLTGLLEDAGVYLGGVSKKNPHNLKGNQENLRVMHLHDQVLAANGSGWDNPPAGPVQWSEAQRAQLREILQEYVGHARWAFKDPRALFTLPAWQELVPDLVYIGTFRHPSAVAQSLHRRGRMPAQEGFALWRRYNIRLLEERTRHAFDLLCFDLEPLAYMQSVQRAFARLGLEVSHASLGFFEENLRNTAIEPMFASPPVEVMRIYEVLRRMAA